MTLRMMNPKKSLMLFVVLFLALGVFMTVLSSRTYAAPNAPDPSPTASGGAADESGGGAVPKSVVDTGSLPKTTADAGKLQAILNVVFGIIGSISVLVVAVGGLRYVLAHGDTQAVAQAKETILYALIGVIISVIAVAIVNFVGENITS